MSFLQPAMLLALPAVALPIIIHLIHQRRFQNVPWAAMQFLLTANRMSRGYARIRQWLILAARALAIAGLLFAVSRPLASGWLGLAGGGRVDTTFILLDRSPSMHQRGPDGRSKLESGLDRLRDTLALVDSNRYVLIDSVHQEPIALESPEALNESPHTSPASSAADIPAMLEIVDQYIRRNRPSQCEVWICSDIRSQDWNPDSARWDTIRRSLQELQQTVRIHLLAYPTTSNVNRTLRVEQARRIEGDAGAELLLSLRITQATPTEAPTQVPIRLELGGARSEFTAELIGGELELRGHSVPIDQHRKQGWGRVSIPADTNSADDEFYFVYDTPVPRHTLIVADRPEEVKALRLAASISTEPSIRCTAKIVSPEEFSTAVADDVSLVLWQSVLPPSETPGRLILQSLIGRGGRVIFFPPDRPDDTQFAGLSWTSWREPPSPAVGSWVSDRDLLVHSRSGDSLPVGQWKVKRLCGMDGERVALATLDGGATLLARAMTDQPNVYFCGTTASESDSSLAPDGIVLYAMVQRALAAGAASLASSRQLTAGEVRPADAVSWQRVAGSPSALSNEYPHHAGIYRSDEQWLAVNRASSEDRREVVADDRLSSLFGDLDFDRVDDQAGSTAKLIREVWRLFLIGMLAALLLESVLCLPRRRLDPPPLRTEGGLR